MGGWLIVGLLLGVFACTAGTFLESRKMRQAIERVASLLASQAEKK
jgi:hypothetical protein